MVVVVVVRINCFNGGRGKDECCVVRMYIFTYSFFPVETHNNRINLCSPLCLLKLLNITLYRHVKGCGRARVVAYYNLWATPTTITATTTTILKSSTTTITTVLL